MILRTATRRRYATDLVNFLFQFLYYKASISLTAMSISYFHVNVRVRLIVIRQETARRYFLSIIFKNMSAIVLRIIIAYRLSDEFHFRDLSMRFNSFFKQNGFHYNGFRKLVQHIIHPEQSVDQP